MPHLKSKDGTNIIGCSTLSNSTADARGEGKVECDIVGITLRTRPKLIATENLRTIDFSELNIQHPMKATIIHRPHI